MANVLFNDEPLVIDLTLDVIQELLPPVIKRAYSELGIERLEIKNIFNLVQVDDAGESFRTMAQLKLPEQIWENGYLNVFDEPEQWVPIYCSSGINSSKPGRWHPYLGAINTKKLDINNFNIEQSIYGNLNNHVFPLLKSKDPELVNNALKDGGLIKNGEYYTWFAKCTAVAVIFPRRIRRMLRIERENYRRLGESASSDLDESRRRLVKLAILLERFERINIDLFEKKASLNYRDPSEDPEAKEIGYMCNNFFILINETLQILFKTKKESFTVAGRDAIPISSVTEDINDFMNKVIGSNNVFGLSLFRESVAQEAIDILNIIEDEENFAFIIAQAIKNWGAPAKRWEEWLGGLIEYLKEVVNILPLNNLIIDIINDERFAASFDSGSSGSSSAVGDSGGEGKIGVGSVPPAPSSSLSATPAPQEEKSSAAAAEFISHIESEESAAKKRRLALKEKYRKMKSSTGGGKKKRKKRKTRRKRKSRRKRKTKRRRRRKKSKKRN